MASISELLPGFLRRGPRNQTAESYPKTTWYGEGNTPIKGPIELIDGVEVDIQRIASAAQPEDQPRVAQQLADIIYKPIDEDPTRFNDPLKVAVVEEDQYKSTVVEFDPHSRIYTERTVVVTPQLALGTRFGTDFGYSIPNPPDVLERTLPASEGLIKYAVPTYRAIQGVMSSPNSK